MNIDNLKEIWDILKKICSEVGQRVVYLVLQKIFNQPHIQKSKRYDKYIIEIFTEVRFLYK